MWNRYVSSFAPVAHNLLFSTGVRVRVRACKRVCVSVTFQQQKPEKVWLTRHWILLFLGTEGCWSVRIPISSKRSLPVTHSDPLHLSHTAKHTPLPSFLSSRAGFFPLLSLSVINTVSHFLSVPFIRCHKKKSCLTPLYCTATPSSSSLLPSSN